MPGRDGEALEVVRLEQLRLVRDAGSRADERHVAAQDVQQLRQLVEARLAQPAPGPRHDVRALELVEAAVLRASRPSSSRCGRTRGARRSVGVHAHRPELESRERPLVEAEPRLPEEHRAGRVELDPQRDDGEERRAARSRARRGDHDVDRALQRAATSATGLDRRQADERAAPRASWISALRAERPRSSRGTMSTCTSASRSARISGEHRPRRAAARRRRSRGRRRARGRALGSSSTPPSTVQLSVAARRGLRRRSRRGSGRTRGAAEQLLADALPDLAGTDDDRVLDVADAPAADRPRAPLGRARPGRSTAPRRAPAARRSATPD